MHTHPLTSEQDRAAILAHTGLAATHAPRGQVVAETYHPQCRSLCLEVRCPDPADGRPELVSIGEMLIVTSGGKWRSIYSAIYRGISSS